MTGIPARSRPATVVLVHGAFCGSWAYWKLEPELAARGVPFVGIDLPSCRAPDTSVGPADDVRHVQEVLDGIGGPVVLAGKSYGGAVITGAAVDRPTVGHLVYVAASMPEIGESIHQSLGAALTPEFSSGLRFLDDGRLSMDPDVGAQCAFTQATAADQDVWREHGTPMSMGPDPAHALDTVAWTTIPSTYLVCTEDRAVRPDRQRAWATRATHVVEAPFDHSPGVSHPAALADLLAETARALTEETRPAQPA